MRRSIAWYDRQTYRMTVFFYKNYLTISAEIEYSKDVMRKENDMENLFNGYETIYDLKVTGEFRVWWFALPVEIRKTLHIRDCVIAWNAAKKENN